MLPQNAVWLRAPRPLYPSIVTAARELGVIRFTPRQFADDASSRDVIRQGVRVLVSANLVMAVACIWMFFALLRFAGSDTASAAMGSIAAGAGFGFSFWTSQAVPEVLSYFSVALFLAAVALSEERELRAPLSHAKSAALWGGVGLLTGILVLGKELYLLNLTGVLFLLWRRRWAGAAAFLAVSLVPGALWRHYIVDVRHIFDPERYRREYNYILWFTDTLFHQPLPVKVERFAGNLWRQALSFARAFVFVVPVAAAAGLWLKPLRRQWVPLAIFLLSFSALQLGSNFIMPRISFMAWPVVYLFAWRAVEWCGEWLARRFADAGQARRARLGTARLPRCSPWWRCRT